MPITLRGIYIEKNEYLLLPNLSSKVHMSKQ